MQELILLGRSSVANLEDFARPGELQGGQSIVEAKGWMNFSREKLW